MKYVSFSLWGDKSIYNVGAIKNSELIPHIYEDWKMVVFYDNTVPENTLIELNKNNVKLVNMTGSGIYGMFWRFLGMDFEDCEYIVFRDCDSRVTVREKLAVDEWISSGKKIHVMRDHPYHQIPAGNNELGILGGMWGIKGGLFEMKTKIQNISHIHSYGIDQTFLKTIYHEFINDRKTHDPFFEKIDFPIGREKGRFVGDRIDENDKPIGNDYLMIS